MRHNCHRLLSTGETFTTCLLTLLTIVLSEISVVESAAAQRLDTKWRGNIPWSIVMKGPNADFAIGDQALLLLLSSAALLEGE